jgi:hypothetical protein
VENVVIKVPQYPVRVRVEIDEGILCQPIVDQAYLRLSNHEYIDMKESTWEEAEYTLLHEHNIFCDSLKRAENDEHFDELLDNDYYETIIEICCGCDFGVAAATQALNAAGCFTFFSCNGHKHGQGYPFILFHVRLGILPTLIEAANESHTGLVNGGEGCAEIFSDSMDGLMRFAASLLTRRNQFERLPVNDRQLSS